MNFNGMSDKKSVVILMADDNEDDFLLTQRAFDKNKVLNPLLWVKDGQELLDYLHRKGIYNNDQDYPMPGIILLDLNMPNVDGRAALAVIKEDPVLKKIATIIMTTSSLDEDIVSTYNLGVNSYIRKPVDVTMFVEMIGKFKSYWLELVELPKAD